MLGPNDSLFLILIETAEKGPFRAASLIGADRWPHPRTAVPELAAQRGAEGCGIAGEGVFCPRSSIAAQPPSQPHAREQNDNSRKKTLTNCTDLYTVKRKRIPEFGRAFQILTSETDLVEPCLLCSPRTEMEETKDVDRRASTTENSQSVVKWTSLQAKTSFAAGLIHSKASQP